MVKYRFGNFCLEVISNYEELIHIETLRVMFYLENYEYYVKKGYASTLRFPRCVNPDQFPEIALEHFVFEKRVKEAVVSEFYENKDLYLEFVGLICEEIERMRVCIPVAEDLYGFLISGDYRIAPTAYGTIGSSHAHGNYGPMVFRIPKFLPKDVGCGFTTCKYRSLLEVLVHEVLSHGSTAKLREGTTICEFLPMCSHQQHKERLMDLLGYIILTETNLMKPDDVAMQRMAIDEAGGDIDPFYFDKERNLLWRGNLKGLIERIDTFLRNKGGVF